MSTPGAPATPSTLGQVERHLFLRAVLAGVDVGAAAGPLASAIRDAYFPAGTVIYREGESVGHLHFLVEGTVSLEREGEAPWLMQPRSVFAALDAALDQPHARTAVAVDDVHVMLLAVEEWQDILEDHFELAQAIVLHQARSLHELCLRLAPTGGFAEPSDPPPSSGGPSSTGRPGELDAVERLLVLTESRMFERAGVQPLLKLAQSAHPRHLGAGELLYEQGDWATDLFIVAQGVVEVERQEPLVRASFGRGALVAGPSALAGVRPLFTARASADAVVLGLRRDDVADVMEDHFAALRSVLAYLALERDRMQRLEAARRASAARH